MLTDHMHEQTRTSDRELRELAHSRPRYDRIESRRGLGVRGILRGFALSPARAVPSKSGALPEVLIRPAAQTDTRAIARLSEASERRLPSGLVLVAEVEAQVVAALPLDERYVLTDLLRPTGDVVQLLELRSGQLRAARAAKEVA